MIDTIDYKIITALRKNGRRSNASLAREIGINVATIAKRINAMLREDIFSVRAVLNPYKVGLNEHAFITIDVDIDKIDNVCNELVHHPNISMVVTTFGRFDILLIADFTNLEMFGVFSRNELFEIDGVRKVNAFLVRDIRKRYEDIFEDEHTSTPILLDAIDQQLIYELKKNGKANYADLSDSVKLSVSSVLRRTRSLLSKNVIKIIAVPNPSKLGYSSDAFIFIQAKLANISEICDELSRYPEVHLCMTLLNGPEIVAGINCENPELLYSLLKDKVSKLDGVIDMETFIRAEIKRQYYSTFKVPVPCGDL
jgi:Lrp/AsnC family leucine-responsive transcriptional regulator